MTQKTYLDKLMANGKEFAELFEKEYKKVKIAEFKKILKDIKSFYHNNLEGMKRFFMSYQEMIKELKEKKLNRER